MKPAPFDYVRPRRLDEALDHLADHGADARVLAGGQSLVPLLNLRTVRPKVLVDVNGVAELDYVRVTADAVEVGALTRQRRLELDPRVTARLPLLADALPLIGRIATRNRGTVGGSLAHADPAAELPSVAVACGAELSIASANGSRVVDAERFFVAAYRTVLDPGELVTGVRFPVPSSRTGQAWVEYGRRYADRPVAGVACALTLSAAPVVEGPVVEGPVAEGAVIEDAVIEDAVLVCAGVGDRPLRPPAVERLIGARPSAAAFSEVARAAAEWSTADGYRRRLVHGLALRALDRALRRAAGEAAARSVERPVEGSVERQDDRDVA
ncbi:FAD binding domain-containing protein [Microtetraspora sp. AC03309]|uniref:FAD binding domain-containing protein n=1 Tax=Microtetraspora sp. AC03309 TaxID=2779376 RepID=UPI001E59FF01|nr:FAD binding domain-containing protein [Microtetraspora sp. AC03309]MCC5579550.1 FAD binding domain-containing protein [Microtetraspora sp. AC03309]